MFRATHVGGPMDGAANDVHMAAPSVPGRLMYAPSTFERAPFPSGYMSVGFDDVMADLAPWPGQVEYRLDREASGLAPHEQFPEMETGVAVYRYVEEG